MIIVNNENFIESILALKSKGFNEEQYHFLYDSLNKENKKYLLENILPKEKILIFAKKSLSIKPLFEKYKHQIRFTGEEVTIYGVLDKIFQGRENKEKLVNELSNFNNHLILQWLESTAATSIKLAKELTNIEKFIYSKHFIRLVVYNCYGLKCKATWKK